MPTTRSSQRYRYVGATATTLNIGGVSTTVYRGYEFDSDELTPKMLQLRMSGLLKRVRVKADEVAPVAAEPVAADEPATVVAESTPVASGEPEKQTSRPARRRRANSEE